MSRLLFITTLWLSLLLLLKMETTHGAEFATKEPFFAQKYAEVNDPRGLLVDEFGDILVLSRSPSIVALYEHDNGDGTISVNQTLIVDGTGLGLTHGIAYANNFLYASSSTSVMRWPYTPGQRKLIIAQPQIVVKSIPSGAGMHVTRTLAFDSDSRLYVSIGSAQNIDPNSNRARVRRFPGVGSVPDGGHVFDAGEIFADGLRNAVGLDFDSTGSLWAVENSGDNLERADLGGDIHEKNPADELNKLTQGVKYGYPYCFTSYDLEGYDQGTQFAWPTFLQDGVHTDAWCRNEANNKKPTLPLESHNAPLGLHFYKGINCGVAEGSFPCSATGDAIVSYHGSWNSDVKVGYRVTWLPFDKSTITPLKDKQVDILFEPNLNKCKPCLRPVNAIFNRQGHLIISADASNEIFRVTYSTPPKPIRQAGDNSAGGFKINFACLVFMITLLKLFV